MKMPQHVIEIGDMAPLSTYTIDVKFSPPLRMVRTRFWLAESCIKLAAWLSWCEMTVTDTTERKVD